MYHLGIYAETAIPVDSAHVPLIEDLTLEAAYRVDDLLNRIGAVDQ